MLLAGRGSGKTRAGAEYALDHLEILGPKARVGIGAPTFAAARDVCAEGESGLITIAPDRFEYYNRSLGQARHVKGGFVQFLGAEEPKRWNGPQWTLLWADELALWDRRSWDQAQFGLRLPPRPRAVVTTTPKAEKFVRELSTLPGTIMTHATTFDNPHLAQTAVTRLTERYGGTRLGQQELEARWLLDTPGALWHHDQLDDLRVLTTPEFVRTVVAVDPAVTSGEESDETGIIVAAKGVDGHGYVLGDRSCRLSPDGWAQRAVQAYHDSGAGRLVAEVNNGGDLVERVIRTVSPSVSYKAVHASRGKRTRAEPVAALYEQGKVHHVGGFPQLEDQMCAFTPEGYIGQDNSPDHADALVWALTELMIEGGTTRFF